MNPETRRSFFARLATLAASAVAGVPVLREMVPKRDADDRLRRLAALEDGCSIAVGGCRWPGQQTFTMGNATAQTFSFDCRDGFARLMDDPKRQHVIYQTLADCVRHGS